MRKWVLVIFMLVSLTSWAASDAVLVTGVEGAVMLEGGGAGKVPLKSFVRLGEGDRLTLAANAKASLVYLGYGRQEHWKGPGSLIVGEAESKPADGKPEVSVRQLPPEVSIHLYRTPTTAGEGRTGAVRFRNTSTAKLESDVAALRKEVSAGDLTPDVYLLAGLFGMKEYDRIETELKRLLRARPKDADVLALHDLYSKAIAKARATP